MRIELYSTRDKDAILIKEFLGINKNPFIFSITKEGKEFLMLTKQMQEVYNEKCRLK